jgi:hypothetical protein
MSATYNGLSSAPNLFTIVLEIERRSLPPQPHSLHHTLFSSSRRFFSLPLRPQVGVRAGTKALFPLVCLPSSIFPRQALPSLAETVLQPNETFIFHTLFSFPSHFSHFLPLDPEYISFFFPPTTFARELSNVQKVRTVVLLLIDGFTKVMISPRSLPPVDCFATPLPPSRIKLFF